MEGPLNSKLLLLEMWEENIEVILPNLHHRHTGVTSTVSRLLPILEKSMVIASTGAKLSKQGKSIPLWKPLFFSRKTPRIWHARRNNEMLLGIIFKFIFFCNIKLVFTTSKQKSYSLFSRFLISKIDKIIATSKSSQLFLSVPSEVISHGVDVEVFKPEKNKDSLRKDLNLPSEFLVGCFGRIRPLKGTDIFVDSAIQLLKKTKNCTFIIAGQTTPQFKNFKARQVQKIRSAHLEEKVLFFDEINNSEIFKWYQSMDLFIAPGRYEGFGLTVIEAMASGVPAVAFKNVGTYSEQIKDKETGHLINQISSEKLTKKLESIIKNKRALKDMGQKARHHTKTNFDINLEAEALIKVYKELLKE